MKTPLISILITSYNIKDYIAGAIESVLMQKSQDTFKIEILVGDDGSTDGTVDVIQEYIQKEPDIISIYEMPREAGVNYNRVERSSANRINLLKHAKGDYVSFLDGDDFYTDDRKLLKQVEILEKDKTLSLCTHNVSIYAGKELYLKSAPDGQRLSRAKKNHRWSFSEYWSVEFIQANAMLFRNYYKHGNDKLAKTLEELLEDNIALKNNFDDNNITLAFFMYGDMYYISDVMGAYRQLPDSSWNAIDELKKHVSNMIGFSLELEILKYVKQHNSNVNINNYRNAMFARHFVNMDYLANNEANITKDSCQPFYDTAVKYNIKPALLVYNNSWDEMNVTRKKANVYRTKAKLKRALLKLIGNY